RTTLSDELVKAGEAFIADKANWFTFGAWRVMELLAALRFTKAASNSLCEMILRLLHLLEMAERGRMPDFEPTEAHLAHGFEVDNARIRLQRYAGPLIPGVISAIQHLPTEVVVQLLRFDLASSSPGKELEQVLPHIDPALLDETLVSITDRWAQRSALEMACASGLTQCRL